MKTDLLWKSEINEPSFFSRATDKSRKRVSRTPARASGECGAVASDLHRNEAAEQHLTPPSDGAQLDFALPTPLSTSRRRSVVRPCSRERAAWWFAQMRRAVDDPRDLLARRSAARGA
jgi:hypothetical protein